MPGGNESGPGHLHAEQAAAVEEQAFFQGTHRERVSGPTETGSSSPVRSVANPGFSGAPVLGVEAPEIRPEELSRGGFTPCCSCALTARTSSKLVS